MTAPAFAALIPDAAWSEHLLACKADILAAVGPQRYLEDPPHLTVHLAVYPEPAAMVAAVADCMQRCLVPQVQVEGWHVFRDDPLTGGHTPVCAIAPAGQIALRIVQAQVIAALAPLRDTTATTARYAAHWDGLGSGRQASVRAHGFPFTGADWHPHVSVCSVARSAWDQAWALLQKHERRGTMGFQALRWYQLDGDRPKLLEEFRLAAHEAC